MTVNTSAAAPSPTPALEVPGEPAEGLARVVPFPLRRVADPSLTSPAQAFTDFGLSKGWTLAETARSIRESAGGSEMLLRLAAAVEALGTTPGGAA
jgi:hypothetical protein